MKKRTLLITAVIFALVAVPAMAMQGHDSHGSGSGHDMKSDKNMDQDAHGKEMDNTSMGGMFKHHDSMDGMNADFQVMSLASMNMTSDKGETHHIMVNLSRADGGTPIKNAVGKIKVVGPEGKEQVSTLKNYSGILAANFTFKEPGKYGVICLLKNEDKKQVFKFWYHHM
ncbi:MAG: hypothetical protein HGJ94_01820 [Desulfosarcina sp.]|nr:hypothetical protein [Desulfosarcina sp.]MBC2745001.1 hypothetical protein [Desulfosarcina sp.]MBC2767909.1 hypothetical protein [Desulfosarcina sp.]